jgi:signal transduction histidine kinase
MRATEFYETAAAVNKHVEATRGGFTMSKRVADREGGSIPHLNAASVPWPGDNDIPAEWANSHHVTLRRVFSDSDIARRSFHELMNTIVPKLAVIEADNDSTERTLAPAERLKVRERRSEAARMEAVGRFVVGIAHDFNNVLAGILAYAELLHDQLPEQSRQKRHAENVLTAAARGRALVDQMLAYGKREFGEREPIDLVRIVAETLDLLRGSLPPHVALDWHAPVSRLVVIANATELHRVVMNVCSNAIHALGAGGILRVALALSDVSAPRGLSHGTLSDGCYACLTVEDTGCGMDAATVARTFEPFFTTKKAGRGTGLGLSLVHAIVTDLAGAIDVKSSVGRGTTFAVYLPLR